MYTLDNSVLTEYIEFTYRGCIMRILLSEEEFEPDYEVCIFLICFTLSCYLFVIVFRSVKEVVLPAI